MKPIVLYRRTLDVRSGAGQLIQMQAEGLREAGARVQIMCRRGSLRFLVRTGWRVKRLSAAGVAALNGLSSHLVVDEELQLPGADLVFVHGLASEAGRYRERDDWSEARARERQFFRALVPTTPLVAASRLLKRALVQQFGVVDERIRVHHPGFWSDRFDATKVAELRREARRALDLDEATPLVGFVTSGDFQTRGLDTFLATADLIAASEPEAKFLVVGSKRLPDWACRDPLVTSGRVFHRPKSSRPERWMSALDVFLYASRFDAFGMVISEAQALGIPVLTSRRVGASECLARVYEPWLIDVPDPEKFAARSLELLRDEAMRRTLATAGREHITAFDHRRYAAETAATILSQNR